MLNNSNGAVTLHRVANNSINEYAQTMCVVHYPDNSVTWHGYMINFLARCKYSWSLVSLFQAVGSWSDPKKQASKKKASRDFAHLS